MQLRRVMTRGTWLPEIDGLRFIAIASVLVSHALTHRLRRQDAPAFVMHHLPTVYALGGHGVLLFFMISGFVLARSFLRAHLIERIPFRLGPYYLRRLTRIEPPYVVALLLSLGFYVVVAHDSLRADLVVFFEHLLYVQHFLWEGRSLNIALWSLEVEIQFYAIAPLIGLVYLIRGRGVRWMVWAGLIALSLWIAHWTITAANVPVYLSGFPPYLPYFLLGFLAADLTQGYDRSRDSSGLWDGFALLLWPAFLLVPEGGGLALLMTVAAVFFAFLSAMYGRWGKRLLSLRPIALIGGMCYSIYLTHLLCYSLLGRIDEAANHLQNQGLKAAVTLLIMIPPALVVGVLFYMAIERPCMDPKWPNKLWARVSGRGAEASQSPVL